MYRVSPSQAKGQSELRVPLLLPRALFFLGVFPMSVALDVDEYHHVRTPWRFRLAWAGIVRTRGQPVASKGELQERKKKKTKKKRKKKRRNNKFQADSCLA